MKRYSSLELLGNVLREYFAAEFCISRCASEVDAGNMLLVPADVDFTARDIRTAGARLEITYLVRLFTHFEGTLRDYWQSIRKKTLRIQMETLIDSVGARRQITADIIRGAHEIRELRNAIAHGKAHAATLSIGECKSRLAKFVSYLPEKW